MTDIIAAAPASTSARSTSYWRAAWKRLVSSKLALACMAVLACYFLMAAAAALGMVGADWNTEVGVSFANPSFAPDLDNPQAKNSLVEGQQLVVDPETAVLDPLTPYNAEVDKRMAQYGEKTVKLKTVLPLGGDKWGRSILTKVIKGGEISIFVGVAAALLATMIGTVLGAFSGYFGGKIGDLLEWFYNVFTSMPYILLVIAFATVFRHGVTTVILVLAFTGWTSVYRLIRAEYIKQRGRDYIQAANAIGASNFRMMFAHILPNVSHLILVQVSQLVVDFIKSEVVLSFLGFGVPTDSVSWGIMINEVLVELVLGKWWQLLTVAVVMSTFVVAFGLFTDLLRDALDPKASRR
ncbi:MAG: ABC transporter permease [Burkholderiales bacterium]|nr:ABC transporter permease [Burkholderiales bacterium]